MEIIGFILGILIGITLGLIGSGGSILTIPILVYLMLISPSDATVYSLFIVGISALVGSFKAMKDKVLDYKMALYFGIPSIISILIMRKLIVPILPKIFFKIADFEVSKDLFIMLFFAILMILSSYTMIRNQKENTNDSQINYLFIVLKGIIIGLITGFIGVGGGFLIIPSLLIYGKLTMKKAVGTSLIIIAINSLIGFSGSLNNVIIEWDFLLKFTLFSVLGIFLGIYLSTKVSNEKLKPAFGWFVLVMGFYIIIKELI